MARPANIFIPRWTEGLDTALDVTVTNPLCDTFIARSALEPGYALKAAEERKITQVGDQCKKEGIKFTVLPVEMLGGWSKGAVLELKRIARKQARQCGEDEDDQIRFFFQRLSICLLKGNSALLLNRDPSFFAPEVSGHH